MRRHINFMNKYFEVSVLGRAGNRCLQVDNGTPQPMLLTEEDNGDKTIRLGKKSAGMQMAVKGDTTCIRAFGRTFTLNIVDPVEQAAEAAGSNSNTARAPMPGVVVEVNVAVGDLVIKGQALATIESMKILTKIKAPCSGKVARIHMEPEQLFDKNAVLVTLAQEEEK
jgi:biotin carboxyl carrier protein